MQQFKDLRKILKRANKDQLLQPVTAIATKGQTGKWQKLDKRNRKKNNYIDTSSNKLLILHMRKVGFVLPWPLGIVQEIKIRPHSQMIYAQTRIYPREWDIKFFGILRNKWIT